MIPRYNSSLRLAITGIGVVTPVGVGIRPFLESLQVGRQGLSKITGVPVPRGKNLAGMINATEFNGYDRSYRMAAAAATEALESAHVEFGNGEQIALIVSTIAGDSKSAEDLYPRFMKAMTPDSDMVRALRLYPNGSLLKSLGDKFGIWGPRLVVTNACASGNIALGIALDLIRQGLCRAVLVVGVESIKLSMIWGAERAGFIGHALRPFHRLRDGSILGEGAGAIVIENVDEVSKRPLLGWLEGFGCVCDRGAAPITLLEDGSGLRRSMSLALADAGRHPEELDYVNAHAPGTKLIDLIECKAVAELCGDHTPRVAINATKSLTAHLSGASAIVEVIATLLQMQEGFLHPNVGLDDPDPALAVSPVGPQRVSRSVTCALSNACGGGGLNTSVLITRPDHMPSLRTQTAQQRGQPFVVTGLGRISLGSFEKGELLGADRVVADDLGRLTWFDIYRWYPKDTNYSYLNRAAQLGAAAAAIAIAEAGLDKPNRPYADDRIAVIAGTFLGGGPEASEVLCHGLLTDPDAIRPSMSLDHGLHLGAALVCRYFGFTGPTYTLTGTCVAGLQAVAIAQELLLSNRADVVVVVAYDALDSVTEKAWTLLPNCPETTRVGEALKWYFSATRWHKSSYRKAKFGIG
jgi:3-oxoacyl-[acyl-carrier-protein] synthase II